MGRANTGLANNSPNENEVSPNRELEHPVPDEDSDSDTELEEDRLGHYMPLSQNPTDAEPFYGSNNDSDDENISPETDMAEATGVSSIPLSDLPDIQGTLVGEVWSEPAPKEVDIELTEKKIDLVKQVMLNVQLPSEAIPDWAKDIPEEDWKTHLMERLKTGETGK